MLQPDKTLTPWHIANLVTSLPLTIAPEIMRSDINFSSGISATALVTNDVSFRDAPHVCVCLGGGGLGSVPQGAESYLTVFLVEFTVQLQCESLQITERDLTVSMRSCHASVEILSYPHDECRIQE